MNAESTKEGIKWKRKKNKKTTAAPYMMMAYTEQTPSCIVEIVIVRPADLPPAATSAIWLYCCRTGLGHHLQNKKRKQRNLVVLHISSIPENKEEEQRD